MRPRLVLLIAILLPGAGHLVLDEVRRAFGFLCFMAALGWLSTRLAPLDASYIGRHAGGFFVYALSITDAYRCALWQARRATVRARAGSR